MDLSFNSFMKEITRAGRQVQHDQANADLIAYGIDLDAVDIRDTRNGFNGQFTIKLGKRTAVFDAQSGGWYLKQSGRYVYDDDGIALMIFAGPGRALTYRA